LTGAFFWPRTVSICSPSEDREQHPGHEQKKENGPPMLAKRVIVAAFAALAVGLASLAFPSSSDLFVDVQPMPTAFAAN